MIAASGFLAALECTKFVFGRDCARAPLGELTALPRPLGWFKGTLLLREGRRGEGKREEGRGREGRGTGTPPP